ncbi:conserved hypothetical protein [delta proteobacterium NaphS2]|nr:conserved hypothetical protein [delta proteobacterium NaphS2]
MSFLQPTHEHAETSYEPSFFDQILTKNAPNKKSTYGKTP